MLKNPERLREWLASFERYFKYFLGFCLTVFWKAFRKTHNNNLAGINTITVRHVVIKSKREQHNEAKNTLGMGRVKES